MSWTPLDLEMEIPAHVWDDFILQIERWNRQTFGGKGDIWVNLTDDKAPEALAHFGFRPLVRRVLDPRDQRRAMSFHLRPRKVESAQSLASILDAAKIKGERWAVTISEPKGVVLFALCHELPRPLLRLAQETLASVRSEADSQVRRVTG